MKVFQILLCSLSLLLSNAAYALDSLMLVSRDAGFFSVFMDVVNTLEAYDAGIIRGVQIDFKKTGLYYDANIGDNWWEYYFEPICLGDLTPPLKNSSGLGEYYFHKPYPYLLHNQTIQKYVQLIPALEDELNSFIMENFTDHYMIGVHYRGTDKRTECGRVSYERMLNVIENQIAKSPRNWKIFIATDEDGFLKTLEEKYQGRICYIDAQRSMDESTPLHTDPSVNHYLHGKEALLDCILLSRTNLLIRTCSNLSECCKYFSPYQQVIFVNWY